jgi:hypothetical protein
MHFIPQSVEGSKDFIYKYALRLSRNNYVDISSFQNLKKAKRVFDIYKWESGIMAKKFGVGANVMISGWQPFLKYENRKWEKVERDDIHAWMGGPMLPCHMFFKDVLELKEWLGEKTLDKLFVEFL